MRRLVLVGALALACGGPARRLDEANAARHAGRAREALAAYQQILGELGDGRLPAADDDVRRRALEYAADVAYLELGAFQDAISYYRRVVALYPASPDAVKARVAIADIYRERLGDRHAAIAQWAEIAASGAPEAPAYQLKVASAYLDLGNAAQARTEARALRDRWPASPEADEAQLLTAQAWALERRGEEAQRAYQALLDRRPPRDVAARAIEGQAQLAAEDGRLDRALELYARALDGHPHPGDVRTAMEQLRRRRAHAQTARPGDRATAFGTPHHQEPR